MDKFILKSIISTTIYLLRNVNSLQQKYFLGDGGTIYLQGNKIYTAGISRGIPDDRIIARLIILV